jgi:hypothetical protein
LGQIIVILVGLRDQKLCCFDLPLSWPLASDSLDRQNFAFKAPIYYPSGFAIRTLCGARRRPGFDFAYGKSKPGSVKIKTVASRVFATDQ